MAELKSSSHSLILSAPGFHKGQARMTNTTTNRDGCLRHHHRGWQLLLCSLFLSISYFSVFIYILFLFLAEFFSLFGCLWVLKGWIFLGLGFVSNGCVCVYVLHLKCNHVCEKSVSKHKQV
ncbi:hypothetical protein ACB092_11G096600 [Castanea dentata]